MAADDTESSMEAVRAIIEEHPESLPLFVRVHAMTKSRGPFPQDVVLSLVAKGALPDCAELSTDGVVWHSVNSK